jgi:hypothetical protein
MTGKLSANCRWASWYGRTDSGTISEATGIAVSVRVAENVIYIGSHAGWRPACVITDSAVAFLLLFAVSATLRS